MQSGSDSNTRAGPVIAGFFRPVIFATHPSGARLPRRIARWPCAYIGLRPGADHVLVLARLVGNVAQVLRDGLAGDRHALAVQQAVVEQHLHHLRDAAGLVQVHRDVAARGLEVAEHRHLAGACARSRRASSGTPAACAIASQCSTPLVEPPVAMITAIAFSIDFRVTMSLRLQVRLHRLDQHLHALRGALALLVVLRGHRRGVGQRHADRLDRRGHRVRGVHAAAGAHAGQRLALDALEVFLRHLAGGERRRPTRTRETICRSWPLWRPGLMVPP